MVDSGAVAWVLTATALVMVMSPGLGLFYGGLVRRKNVVSTIAQSFVIFAVVSLVWALWGYSEAFGPTVGGVIGDLSKFGLDGVGATPLGGQPIPELLFFVFQLAVAGIAAALIIGAFVERIRFKALLPFTIAWVTFVYAPVAHWVWGGGWLQQLGAIDFAGGLVVHLSAGASAVAAALVVGKRTGVRPGDAKPANIPYVIVGAALLWFGWFGFNAGGVFDANALTVQVLVNTNMAGAAAAISWMLLDWARRGKPSAIGFSVGAVAGLVAVTPAAGYVGVQVAILIGLVVGLLSNLVANWRASRAVFDDTLDVFACHGVGGMWGVFATGIFASAAVNGVDGALYGNLHLLGIEVFAIAVVGAFSFLCSYLILKVIGLVTPLRVTAEEEELGLDASQHDESAYS